MFLGKLEEVKKFLGEDPNLDKALKWVMSQNLESLQALPVGKTPIEEGVFVVKILSENFTKEDGLCEIHHIYGDVHIGISDEPETIEYSDVGENVPEVVLNPDTDTALFPFESQDETMQLLKGEFVVFWPFQVHCPKLFEKGTNYKVIVKFACN